MNDITDLTAFRAKKDSERLADLVMEDARLEALREAEEAWKSQLAMSAREMRGFAHSRAERAMQGYSEAERAVMGPFIRDLCGEKI